MRLIAEQEHWTINYTIGAVSYSYYQQKFVFVYLRFFSEILGSISYFDGAGLGAAEPPKPQKKQKPPT